MPPAMATAAGTKKENVVLMLVLLALVIALGGLYVLQRRNEPAARRLRSGAGGNAGRSGSARTATAAPSPRRLSRVRARR